MSTPRHLLTAALAASFLIAGCGDDDDDGPIPEPLRTEETRAEDSSADPDPDTSTTNPAAPPGTGDDAARACEDLGGGNYQVGDAGEVEILHLGETVELVEARPADGWTATGDTDDGEDEVEVTFRSDGREIDFSAEIDDGRLEVEICDG